MFICSGTKFGDIKTNYCHLNEEQLIRSRPVHIWVKAHEGNSSCTSARRSVVLRDTGDGCVSHFTDKSSVSEQSKMRTSSQLSFYSVVTVELLEKYTW